MEMVGKVPHCRQCPIKLLLRHRRCRRTRSVIRKGLLTGPPVESRHHSLHLWVLHHQETPRLHIAPTGSIRACLQHLPDQFVGNWVGFQSSHRARRTHDLEQVVAGHDQVSFTEARPLMPALLNAQETTSSSYTSRSTRCTRIVCTVFTLISCSIISRAVQARLSTRSYGSYRQQPSPLLKSSAMAWDML